MLSQVIMKRMVMQFRSIASCVSSFTERKRDQVILLYHIYYE